MRLLSAIACELDLDVCHFDVEQAFVQSKLDEDVFLRLPRGCDRLSGITFQRGTLSGISLEVFADADYASKATDRRSVSGGVIMCGGASICWFSRTQKCVTLSTSEAEYVALGDAVKELLFLRQVWRFMLPSKVMPCFLVFEDNPCAVQLAQNPLTNSNSKHIGVRHHFLRELVRQRDTKVVQVPSEFQHADILTKALAFDLFAFHRNFLMNLK